MYARDRSAVIMTCTSDTLPSLNCTRSTTYTDRFVISMDDENLSGTNHTIKISMYTNVNDQRITTFIGMFNKVPYFQSQLSTQLFRFSNNYTITIPPATDDQSFKVYYKAVHNLPTGLSVDNTTNYGNTFDFEGITQSMSGTYDFNVSACSNKIYSMCNTYTVPITINLVPTDGTINSTYSFPAYSDQNLSLSTMIVDPEGDDITVSI